MDLEGWELEAAKQRVKDTELGWNIVKIILGFLGALHARHHLGGRRGTVHSNRLLGPAGRHLRRPGLPDQEDAQALGHLHGPAEGRSLGRHLYARDSYLRADGPHRAVRTNST